MEQIYKMTPYVCDLEDDLYRAANKNGQEDLDKADWYMGKLMRLADLENICGYTRLRELAEADKEGRLVVLPCNKVLTNADRMRTATNQQLAKQLYDTQKELCKMLYKNLGFEDELNFSEDYSDILAWLNAPSKEAEKALEAMKNE